MQVILKYIPRRTDVLSRRPDQRSARAGDFFEIIREKLINATREELPYSTAVIIDRFEEAERLYRIFATIFVERESQKGIVIGKGGDLLKKIGTEARLELEKFFDQKIFLELHVKVKKNWRDDEATLRSIGLS